MNAKRLYRSRTESMLGGVCGGLGDYFNMDPSIFRLIFILLFLLGGHGLLIYIILWLVLPLQPVTAAPQSSVVDVENK